VTTSQPWVFIGEPGKVDLLIRDRLAVATPAGADALKAAYARLRGTIDPARTIANISAERDRLLRVDNDLPASCKKAVVEPRWPTCSRWHRAHDPPAV